MDKVLSVKDNIEYRSHVEVMRLFGKEMNCHQLATWNPKGVKDWLVWMPIIPRSEVNTNTSGVTWLNRFELGGLYIREYAVSDATDEYLNSNTPKADPNALRLVFAKEKKNNSTYRFKGVYVLDSSRTKEGNHYFRRIAESVLLKGEPVTEAIPLST